MLFLLAKVTNINCLLKLVGLHDQFNELKLGSFELAFSKCVFSRAFVELISVLCVFSIDCLQF